MIVFDAAQIPADKPLYIYGAGAAGASLLERLLEGQRANVVAFVDSHKRGRLFGREIITPDDFLRQRSQDALTLIASQWRNEIGLWLLSKKIEGIYDAYPLAVPADDGGEHDAPVPTAAGLLKRGKAMTVEGLAKFDSLPMSIDVHINPDCSHGCGYCLNGILPTQRTYNAAAEMGARRYADALLSLARGQKCRYRLCGGGESAEHSAFEEVLQILLTAGHEVIVLTHGFTSKRLAQAVAPLSAEQIRRVTISLSGHFGAYLDSGRHDRIGKMLDVHFPRIAEAFSEVAVILPLTPSVLFHDPYEGYIAAMKDTAERLGCTVSFNAVELHGRHLGRHFPSGYDDRERERVNHFLHTYGLHLRRKTPDAVESIAALDGRLYLKGLPCFYATKSLTVDKDGAVYVCGGGGPQKYRIGVLGDAAALAAADLTRINPCPFDHCGCLTGGLAGSLEPMNISLREYQDEIDRWAAATATPA